MTAATFQFLALTQAAAAAIVVQRAHVTGCDDCPELGAVSLAVLTFGAVLLMVAKVVV